MIGRDLSQIKSFYEYKKEKLSQLNIKIPDEFLYNKYDIIKDKLNRIKIKLNIFKGISHADKENYELNKLKMIRLRLDFSHLLTNKAVSITDVIMKETVEKTDIQFEILEKFLMQKYRPQVVRKALLPIYEKYDSVKPGSYLGYIFLNYDEFVTLSNFLKPALGIVKKSFQRR